MTNLSSLSRVGLSIAVAAVSIVVIAAVRLLFGPAVAPWDSVAELVAVAVFLGLAVQALRRTARNINRASEVCVQAFHGNLEARIFGKPDGGDLGKLQIAVNDMLDIVDAFVREASASMEYASRGKTFRKVLARGLPGAFKNGANVMNAGTNAMDHKVRELSRVAEAFGASMDVVAKTLSSAATELGIESQAMAGTAEETSRQASAVATASEDASVNVQTVASAAEELSSSISEISRQVTESGKITHQAVAEADRTNIQIKGLAEAGQRIGDVVKLIGEIASQTNLLALNATIEAARAGEAGKGFAVVASEVKNLANQTATATDEIGSKITEMQAATTQSVEAVMGIGRTIGRINEISSGIAAAVEEQGAATQVIARNVQQVSAGTSKVSSNAAGISQVASDTGRTAARVKDASGKIGGEVDTLRKEVGRFLASVKAK